METANPLPDNSSADTDLVPQAMGILPEEEALRASHGRSDEHRNRQLTEMVNAVLASEETSLDLVLHRMQLTSLQEEEQFG